MLEAKSILSYRRLTRKKHTTNADPRSQPFIIIINIFFFWKKRIPKEKEHTFPRRQDNKLSTKKPMLGRLCVELISIAAQTHKPSEMAVWISAHLATTSNSEMPSSSTCTYPLLPFPSLPTETLETINHCVKANRIPTTDAAGTNHNTNVSLITISIVYWCACHNKHNKNSLLSSV